MLYFLASLNRWFRIITVYVWSTHQPGWISVTTRMTSQTWKIRPKKPSQLVTIFEFFGGRVDPPSIWDDHFTPTKNARRPGPYFPHTKTTCLIQFLLLRIRRNNPQQQNRHLFIAVFFGARKRIPKESSWHGKNTMENHVTSDSFPPLCCVPPGKTHTSHINGTNHRTPPSPTTKKGEKKTGSCRQSHVFGWKTRHGWEM